MLACRTPVLAQNRSVAGKVIDSLTGKPLPGVSIAGKGTGTTTDANGNFIISLSDKVTMLTFSFVGYNAQQIQIANKTTINIALTQQSNSLSEVVIVNVGYGTLNQKEVSSAITHISSKELLSVASNSPLMALQGKVAGLTITNTATGDPNSTPTVQLRGVSSRSAGLGPLYVINNVPGGNIDNINQNDIESIDVLKGGAASAIYGTRGSNGVIIITTKKGTSQSNILYEGYTGFDYLTNQLPVLSTDDFIKDRVDNKQGQNYGGNTNWMDAVSRSPAFTQKHTLQLSGGSGQTNYFASADYRNADGVDLRAHKQEYGTRVNINHKDKNNIYEASLTVAPRYMKTSNADQGNFNNALTLNPTIPIYTPAGGYNFINTGFFSNNPVENAKVNLSQAEIKELDINGSFKVNILKNLSTTVTVSEISQSVKNLNFSPSIRTTIEHSGQTTQTNYAEQEQVETDQKNIEWTGNYALNIGKNHFKLLGGYSFSAYNYQEFYAQNFDFPFDTYTWNNLNSGLYNGGAAGQGQGAVGSTQNSSKLISFFSRMNYDFDNKYLFTASLRREGSSKFGLNDKWGNFPAASAAWRVSEEDFLKGSSSWLSELKLRADYGVTGNQDFGSYQSLLLYGGYGYFPFNGTVYQVYGPATNVNPDLSWEKAVNFNAGIDFSLFNRRINGSLDYYVKTDKNLLGYYNVPLPPNSQSQTFANVGTMRNSGFEIALNATAVKTSNFSYTITLTGAYNKNKFLSFSNTIYQGAPYIDQAELSAPGSPGPIQRIQEGQSIGNFYTLKSAGVDATGALLVYTKDGKIVPANVATNDDRQIVGNGLPKFTGSLGNTLSYKHWDLSVFFRGAFDYKIFNNYAFYIGTPSTQADANVLKSAYDSKSKYSKLTNSSTNSIASDYFLEPGDFVKIDNVTLGYSHPIASRIINHIRIYVTGKNLHTFTKYTGGDPDLVQVNGLTPGVNTGLNYYPSTLQLLFGLQATF
ncbi:SusC/RagA family TonB-linked outer membrane protein [Pedobacter sp. L105]|uniref:SusC/RagA family TonB-linked outer membrane protein n=1 Tax=Pedobacter sp. L105 TaxID=1641871 RepID=UPI0020B10AD6|nr:SusC/RagA family TonB-linked outer membrane protein [Pedobacter sp. L105]